jgi:hypothetical protein
MVQPTEEEGINILEVVGTRDNTAWEHMLLLVARVRSMVKYDPDVDQSDAL